MDQEVLKVVNQGGDMNTYRIIVIIVFNHITAHNLVDYWEAALKYTKRFKSKKQQLEPQESS